MIKNKFIWYFFMFVLALNVVASVGKLVSTISKSPKIEEVKSEKIEYQLNLINILYDSDNISETSKDSMINSIETYGPYDQDAFNKEISLAKSIHNNE